MRTLLRPSLAFLALVTCASVACAQSAAPFDPVAATDAYIAKIPADLLERTAAYDMGNHYLILWNFLLSSVIALLLLATGLSARMLRVAERICFSRANADGSPGRRAWLVPLFYVVQYMLISALLTLPMDLYQGYYREHQYNLSNLTLPAYLGEQATGLAISLVIMSLASIILYAVLRRVGRAWWVWASGLMVLLVAVGMLLAPVFIAPLFNQYKRLDDPAQRDPLVSMARANRIPSSDIWVFDASKQTNRVSANVSGIFGTTRISLNDNLLNRVSPAGVRAVMAHEMGHYVLNHSIKGLIQMSLIITISMGLVAFGFTRIIRSRGTSWGIRTGPGWCGGVADPAALPLIMLLLSAAFFIMTPLTNTVIRTAEVEADAFGLNASREPDGFAEAISILAEYRKMKPGPWEEFFFFDHPSGYNRILAAMTWKGEHLDEHAAHASALGSLPARGNP